MIKHVILDAGGVVCLPRMGSWLTCMRFEEIIGPVRLAAVTPEAIESAMVAAATIYLDEGLPIVGEAMEFAVRRNYFLDLAKRLSWVITDREADALARDMTENDARYDFYPDAREGIQRLGRGRGVHLLSNAMPSLKRVFAGAGILELFDTVVISTDVGSAKPEEKVYRTVLALIEAEPAECAFVDDRIENLETARGLGMLCVHMAREGESAWDGPVAHDLFEVVRLLEE